MYLEENLNLTPQSMSDKATALDELEEMHQQVFLCLIKKPLSCISLHYSFLIVWLTEKALVYVISVVYIKLVFDARP